MSVKKIIQIGDPRLKAKNQAIKKFKDSKLKELIQDLKDTLEGNELVGIAAPQIGENYKILVSEIRNTETRKVPTPDKFRVYINPKIIKLSKSESIIYEGCGSVVKANLFAPVKRPKQITIEAFDENGKKFALTCDGLLARVIQHEFDHLNGIEFTEKIYDYKKIVNQEFYLNDIKYSKNQVENSTIRVLREVKMSTK